MSPLLTPFCHAIKYKIRSKIIFALHSVLFCLLTLIIASANEVSYSNNIVCILYGSFLNNRLQFNLKCINIFYIRCIIAQLLFLTV